MELDDYRNSPLERQRTTDLMALVPDGLESVLDIGARDGFFSRLLTERSRRVTALDLECPSFVGDRIECVKGDVTQLQFSDAQFDLVFCAEVLEHIPTALLAKACAELSRVSRRYILIGVPYKQDIRLGRTTCSACGRSNPPWGHVNRFDEERLRELFAGCAVSRQTFVGSTSDATNSLSATLMDWAGNPYGTYSQEEPCVYCNASIGNPSERTLLQKVCTKAAFVVSDIQKPFLRTHGNWIHMLLEKPRAASTSSAAEKAQATAA